MMAILITKGENLGQAYIAESVQKRLKNVKTLVHLISTAISGLRGLARYFTVMGCWPINYLAEVRVPTTAFYQNNSTTSRQLSIILKRAEVDRRRFASRSLRRVGPLLSHWGGSCGGLWLWNPVTSRRRPSGRTRINEMFAAQSVEAMSELS